MSELVLRTYVRYAMMHDVTDFAVAVSHEENIEVPGALRIETNIGRQDDCWLEKLRTYLSVKQIPAEKDTQHLVFSCLRAKTGYL